MTKSKIALLLWILFGISVYIVNTVNAIYSLGWTDTPWITTLIQWFSISLGMTIIVWVVKNCIINPLHKLGKV